jgi:hypothetical protein
MRVEKRKNEEKEGLWDFLFFLILSRGKRGGGDGAGRHGYGN